MLISVCLALCRAVHVRPARGAEGRSTALPAAAPSRCGQTLHPPLLRDTAAPLRAPAAHQHLNPRRPPPPPVSGGPGGRAAARGGPEREAGMAGMAGWEFRRPQGRAEPSLTCGRPRAPFDTRWQKTPGTRKRIGGAQRRGPRPHHVTGWASSGRAAGGATRGPRPPAGPGRCSEPGAFPAPAAHPALAGTGHGHCFAVRVHERACVSSHPYLSSSGSWSGSGTTSEVADQVRGQGLATPGVQTELPEFL